MNAAWRIESSGKGVAQLAENEDVLMNMEFKRKCHTCGKYGLKQCKCPEKNKSNKKIKGTRRLWASVINVARWGIKLQATRNSRLIKTRGQ